MVIVMVSSMLQYLPKDIVLLIYREIHAYRVTQLNKEYNRLFEWCNKFVEPPYHYTEYLGYRTREIKYHKEYAFNYRYYINTTTSANDSIFKSLKVRNGVVLPCVKELMYPFK